MTKFTASAYKNEEQLQKHRSSFTLQLTWRSNKEFIAEIKYSDWNVLSILQNSNIQNVKIKNAKK